MHDTGTVDNRRGAILPVVEFEASHIFLLVHYVRANASRCPQEKSSFHPRGRYPEMLFPEDSLARQLFQLRERRIDRAGADVAGILSHAVEPAIDIENGAFA